MKMDKVAKRRVPMNRAIREALEFELNADPTVFLMGEDIGAFGGVYQTFAGLAEQFGTERVRDTPISEAGFMAAAAGAAIAGMKPVVELMFVDFMGVCLDPLYNFIAKHAYHTNGRQSLPMVLMTGIGGGYSDASQHSQTLFATFAHLPGLKVVAPSNAYDAKGLLHAAIRDPDPVVYMIHKALTGIGWFGSVRDSLTDAPQHDYTVPIGKAFVRREGRDVTIVGLSATVHVALDAAKALAAQGIDAEVIDLCSVVPMDRETLCASVEKTGRLVVVDEDYRSCGVAAEVITSVIERLARPMLCAPRRITFPDTPIPFARVLEQHLRPDQDKVVEAVGAMMEGAR